MPIFQLMKMTSDRYSLNRALLYRVEKTNTKRFANLVNAWSNRLARLAEFVHEEWLHCKHTHGDHCDRSCQFRHGHSTDFVGDP